MKNNKKSLKRIIFIAAAAVIVLGSTAFAAFRLLSAKDAASRLGDSKLARYFEECGTVYETAEDGDYKATVLGIASGENLSDFKSSSWEIFSERTYAVVAVEKNDGNEMTFDDEILVTPLIQGLKPWQYNIFTMNGGYTADIIDGVLYRIIELDSIEYFADREVYMAVLSEPFLNNKPYNFDEKTGKITPKNDYNGTNILIKLNLDKSKANQKKAEEYLEKLNEKVKVSEEEEKTEEAVTDRSGDEDSVTELHENDDFNVEINETDKEVSLIITEK